MQQNPTHLPQMALIERVRQLCRADEQVIAALMFGSFALGEGDEFSDIEFALFFVDEHLPTLDKAAWVAQIAPVELFFLDDNSHYTAIFPPLLRGEFHFKPASAIATVASWQGNAWFPSLAATLVVDRTGVLAQHLQALIGPPPPRDRAEIVQSISHNFINWVLFGSNVLARGESARALDLLSITHRYLLWMARLVEGATQHWPTPSRQVEADLSPAAYARFRLCTAALDRTALGQAYAATWAWGTEMMAGLAQRHDYVLPAGLVEQMTTHIETIRM